MVYGFRGFGVEGIGAHEPSNLKLEGLGFIG